MSYTPAVLILALCLLSGCCGDFQLISFGRYGESSPEALEWHKEPRLRPPRSKMEESVVSVAADHRPVGTGHVMVVYITHEKVDTLVAVVEDTTRTGSYYDPKKVMRYIVEDGLIKATMGPTIEPFPDVALERAALVAIHKAVTEGGWAVVPVLHWREPVAVKAVLNGPCLVDVIFVETVYGGPGKKICSKLMNSCPL